MPRSTALSHSGKLCMLIAGLTRVQAPKASTPAPVSTYFFPASWIKLMINSLPQTFYRSGTARRHSSTLTTLANGSASTTLTPSSPRSQLALIPRLPSEPRLSACISTTKTPSQSR